MSRTTVFIIDETSLRRRSIADCLGDQFEVVGTVGDGSLAQARVENSKPDLVILTAANTATATVGLVKSLRQADANLRIVVLAGRSESIRVSSVELRVAGAIDVVSEQPADRPVAISPETAKQLQLILERLPSTADQTASFTPRSENSPVEISQPSLAIDSKPAEVVAIASSTGGPDALVHLLQNIPNSFDVPIVIVQHISANFSASLAERLADRTGLDVREAIDDVPLGQSIVWIAPAGRHVVVRPRVLGPGLSLNGDPPENSCRPAADVLFRSVAMHFGRRALAVVLTGLGSDGCRGAQAIKAVGGYVLAQDEASSRVWSMPRSVIEAGAADKIVSLSNMALEIVRCSRAPLPSQGAVRHD